MQRCIRLASALLAATVTTLNAQTFPRHVRTLVLASAASLNTNDYGGATLGLGGGAGVETAASPSVAARLQITVLRTITTRDNVGPNCLPSSACVTGIFPQWVVAPELQGLVSPESSRRLWLTLGAGVVISGAGHANYRGSPEESKRESIRGSLRVGMEFKFGRAIDVPRLQVSRNLLTRGVYSMRSTNGVTFILPL